MTVWSRTRPEVITLEWIASLPKEITSSGCWIPPVDKRRDKNGYTQIGIRHRIYRLSRLSLCASMKLDYFDTSFECRHSKDCDKACFNPSHLVKGTVKDNAYDRDIRDSNNFKLNKTNCPRCSGLYSKKILKSGLHKGKTFRFCRACNNADRRNSRK